MSSSTSDPSGVPSAGDGNDVLAARRRAGQALRAAREAAGRELPQLAAQLKVAPSKLQALEAGEWERLPDATFARALLRGACKALRVDPQPLLDLLPPSPGTAAVAKSAATSEGGTVAHPVDDLPARPLPRGGAAGAGHRAWWGLAGLILIAAGVVYFWPAGRWSPFGAGKPAQSVSSAAPLAPAPASAPPAAVASSASRPASSPAGGASAVAPRAVASAPIHTASSPAGGGSLSIQVSGASWVQVTAQGGKVLFSQLLQPGAAQTLAIPAGSLPLSVVVGNAPQTTLTFNGQVVNLAPATRGNVARLTLR